MPFLPCRQRSSATAFWLSIRVVLVIACLLVNACSKRSATQNNPTTSQPGGDSSPAFAQVFCNVLKNEPIPGDRGSDCSAFMTPAAQPGGAPPVEITSAYRLLLVPGYMDACFTGDIATFNDAVAHLTIVHKVTVDIAPTIGLGGSVDNAKLITDFVNTKFTDDKRPYIALGYSKGAPDLMEAFAASQDAGQDLNKKIVGFITYAGVVSGSYLADKPALLNELIVLMTKGLDIKTCGKDDGKGVESMSHKTRQAFLRRYPNQFVPTYALAASSVSTDQDFDSTSKILLSSWQQVAAAAPNIAEDSRMTDPDARATYATYLGLALADHWAIGTPFENERDPLVKPFVNEYINHNRFPRAAMIESLLRFVVADLQAKSGAR